VLAAVATWACSAAIRLWMKACNARAGSELEVVVAEPEDEELVDDVPDDALVLEVLPLVAPICDKASRMELIRAPPDGGGGGAAELTSEELVTSD
jgi:hypothetical protein